MEVCCVFLVVKFPSHDHPGMVIQDHDEVHTAGFPIFPDIWQVTGVCLPHAAEVFFLISFPVLHGCIFRTLKSIMLDIALDGGNGYRCRKCSLLHQFLPDLGGIQPWVFLPEPADFPFRLLWDYPGAAFVTTGSGDQGLHAAFFIELVPFGHSLGLILEHPPVRQPLRGERHPAAVGGHGIIRINSLHQRRNDPEAHLCHFHLFLLHLCCFHKHISSFYWRYRQTNRNHSGFPFPSYVEPDGWPGAPDGGSGEALRRRWRNEKRNFRQKPCRRVPSMPSRNASADAFRSSSIPSHRALCARKRAFQRYKVETEIPACSQIFCTQALCRK